MKNIETLKKLFDKAQSNYPIFKKKIENQIVHWFWTPTFPSGNESKRKIFVSYTNNFGM